MARRTRQIMTDLGRSTTVISNRECVKGVGLKPGILPVTRSWYDNGAYKGSQVTDSEGHPGWNNRSKRSAAHDIGGNFYTSKTVCELNMSQKSCVYETSVNGFDWCQTTRWSGPVYPVHPSDAIVQRPLPTNSSSGQLDTLGASAVARVKPVNPIPNITVLLGETMRDGFPKLPVSTWKEVTERARKSRSSRLPSSRPKGPADDFLNVEFGFKPVASDIASFAAAIVNAEALLAQYERDAGRVVRRRYEFPPTENTTTTIATNYSGTPYFGSLSNAMFSSIISRDLVIVRKTERRQWFSGAFTYYLPSGYDSRREMASIASIAKRMLSLDLTPENIWNLAPWSWAVDWFSNAGDVMSNATSFLNGSLIMRYGYLMEHTITTDTYSMRHPWTFKVSGDRTDGSFRVKTETKVRRRANPFGFGISWEGLSPKQLTIAAALGITRGQPQAR